MSLWSVYWISLLINVGLARAQSAHYRAFEHLKDSPENSRRWKNVILHHDTVLYQGIWVDPHGWNFLITPNYTIRQSMIIPPFKINGEPYYHSLIKRAALPSYIVPDSTLLLVTWWYTDSNHYWQATDEVTVLKGDAGDFMKRLHRPPRALILHDTGIFGGFISEDDKNPPEVILKGHSVTFFEVVPPLLIDGTPTYKLIAHPPENSAVSVIEHMKTLSDKKYFPCAGCPASLLKDSTRVQLIIWSTKEYPKAQQVDEIRTFGKE